jgi:hypothetical protein
MQDLSSEKSPVHSDLIHKEAKFHISHLPQNMSTSTKEKRKLICKKYREKKKKYIISLKTEILHLQQKQLQLKHKLPLSTIDTIINIILYKAKTSSVNLQKDLFVSLINSSSAQIEIKSATQKDVTQCKANPFFSLYTSVASLQKW